MSVPALALCVPAYNAARFLPRLLRSAATQAIPFDEVFVYDDCSTDDTANVARDHGATVIRGERNVGCSAGKNRLLHSCLSEWIHFHDADDELLPNFTSLARRWLTMTEVPDVILFDFEYRDDVSGELLLTSRFNDEELRRDALRYAILTQINPFCGVYRRAALLRVGGYDLDAEILYNEDVAFHCKLAFEGLRFGVEPEVSIINYRVAGSMSASNRARCLKAHCKVMTRLAANLEGRYAAEIAQRLWAASAGLAALQEWGAVDEALTDAGALSSEIPVDQSRVFALLCNMLGPKLAFRVREQAIRIMKPGLR